MWTDHVIYDDTLDKELEEGLDHRNKHVQVHLVSLMIRTCISLHIGHLRLGLSTCRTPASMRTVTMAVYWG